MQLPKASYYACDSTSVQFATSNSPVILYPENNVIVFVSDFNDAQINDAQNS